VIRGATAAAGLAFYVLLAATCTHSTPGRGLGWLRWTGDRLRALCACEAVSPNPRLPLRCYRLCRPSHAHMGASKLTWYTGPGEVRPQLTVPLQKSTLDRPVICVTYDAADGPAAAATKAEALSPNVIAP
jgi:hypothetical protein